MGFLVDRPRSYSILTSEFLVLSQYSSDGTTGGVIFRMARMSVSFKKGIWVGKNFTVSTYQMELVDGI